MIGKGVDTMLRHSPLKIPKILKYQWSAREAFSLRGEPSTVKSEFIFQLGKEEAEKQGREFFDWNRTTVEQKKDAMKRAGDLFVFADVRASETDIGEMRLQDMKNGEEYITYKYGLLFAVLSKPDAMGFLFLDEMNLAPAFIKAQFYKLVNDRCIGDIPLSRDVLVIIAGNEVAHAYGASKDPVPLVLRRANYFIRPLDADEFTDFALRTEHHPWIIGYIAFAPQDVHRISYALPDEVGQPCPRTWTKLSRILKMNAESMKDDDVELVAAAYVGQATARTFVAYVKAARKVNIDDFIKKPELIKDFDSELSVVYAVFTGVVEKFRKDKKVIRPAFEMALHTKRPELGAYLMRSLKAVSPGGFMALGFDMKLLDKDFMDKVTARFGKYLTSDD